MINEQISNWEPVHVKVSNLTACMTLIEPGIGQYPVLWHKLIVFVTNFYNLTFLIISLISIKHTSEETLNAK